MSLSPRVSRHAPALSLWAGMAACAIAHVVLKPARLAPAQRAGLQRSGAALAASAGDAQWWRIPDNIPDNGRP